MHSDPAEVRPPLPDDVDPELWFTSPHPRCRGGRDYLFDKHWLTHPGRMAAYCPHDADWPDYRISLQELPQDLPPATRYWVRGFLAGNLPPAPADSPEMQAWCEAAKIFAETGEWTLGDRDDEQDDEGEDDEPGEWITQPDGTYTFVPAAGSEPKNGAG